MFCIEPSGTSYGYLGCAAGKAKQAAKIIYMVHDEVKDKMFELELSWVTKDTNGKHMKVSEQVHKDAEKFAHAAMEEDSDSDGDE